MSEDNRINWFGFTKLRDEMNLIRAAICNNCNQFLSKISPNQLQIHRDNCYQHDDDMETDQGFQSSDEEDTDNNSRHLHKLLIKFFVSANVPFKQVENKYFLQFVEALIKCQFDYKPPCRKTLGTTVLKKLHDEINNKKKILLDNTDSVLLIDAWKNKSTNRKYLVLSLRNVNTTQTFFKCYDFTREKETGENLSIFINKAIIEAKRVYNTNIFAAVTDNDSKIIKGVRLSETIEHKKLIQFTCASHSGNLLTKAFVDNEFLSKIREIINSFKNSDLESLLISKGGTKLSSLCETRFSYIRDSCVSIYKNIENLRSICRSNVNDINKSVIENIESNVFEALLTEVIDNLDPVCQLINKCQCPDANIADATEFWLSLSLSTNEYDEVISARIDKAIWPVAYAANLVHHKYKGEQLNENQKLVAKHFLETTMDAEIKNEYLTYQEQESTFERYAKNCDDAISYWKLVGWKFPRLSRFIVNLMLLPASTALLESLFSNWTYVHNSFRNRLGDKKSACLVDIYYTLTRDSSEFNTL